MTHKLIAAFLFALSRDAHPGRTILGSQRPPNLIKENVEMTQYRIRFAFALVLCALTLAGCQSDVTLSKAVRKGDTLLVSLGNADPNGEYSNINNTLIRESDVSASIFDSGWVTHPVKVRQVFRVFGDPTAVNARARGKAQWMAVIDLVNPTGSGKPNLALGAAALILRSPAFKEQQVVQTEIISGVGTPQDFVTQNDPGDLGIDKLQFVKPAKQALVSVSGTLPQDTRLAGAEYRFNIPDIHAVDWLSNRLEAASPAKLSSEQQVHFEFSREEREAPIGTDVMVVLTSPEGVNQDELAAFNFVMLSDLDNIANNPSYWQEHFSGAVFYDTDGREIATLGQTIGENE
tara:strand:+ start:1434 stop:2474 length:1041 start_codon:yes stop_codon:yes gene_type:complete